MGIIWGWIGRGERVGVCAAYLEGKRSERRGRGISRRAQSPAARWVGASGPCRIREKNGYVWARKNWGEAQDAPRRCRRRGERQPCLRFAPRQLLRLPCHMEPRKLKRALRFWNVRTRWKTPLLSTTVGRRRVLASVSARE